MRTAGAAIAVILAVGLDGGIASANAQPVSPSVADCVQAWNAAPALTAVHAKRRARITPVASHTFTVTWSRSSSVGMAGPGCIVSLQQAGSHGLVIEGTWKATAPIVWRTPIATTGLTSHEKTNAVLGTNGQITLR